MPGRRAFPSTIGLLRRVGPPARNQSAGIVFVLWRGASRCIHPQLCPTARTRPSTSSSTASVNWAVAFTANYAFGFKNTILAGHLDGKHLIVDDFNVFEDGSGRSAYFTQGTFKKV